MKQSTGRIVNRVCLQIQYALTLANFYMAPHIVKFVTPQNKVRTRCDEVNLIKLLKLCDTVDGNLAFFAHEKCIKVAVAAYHRLTRRKYNATGIEEIASP
ncbi:hypothetical protein BGZ96_001946 [Linnemannia gamsii]|uniref:Uncharacterized protein n=1 Tax=Linnemannia gamsii TaxID=64522 RepID=A0ABQ7JLM8_9FUNG|nr:hypothetical protein BGZ96_001946 [Linnemannia gamsii]